ncbi:FecR family protein [Kordiimonas sp.]|uniref:FecR family protein n=1 Tax=Kordiimonas sp. TaxID=1970157 RepID=UPI003A959AC3
MMTMNQRLDIHEQAAAWVSKLLSGKVSAAEKRANADWRAEDQAQDAAQAELEAMLVELDHVGEHVLADQMVQELNAAVDDKRSRRMFTGVTSIAATFVAAVALSVAMWSPAPDAQIYETAVGERRVVQLEDGSRVQLNTNSKLKAEFSDGIRHVSLERGEAFFDVSHNKERPFVVNAGKTDVTVLGTQFNVRLGASSNLVSVLSGLVAVSQHTRGGQPAKELARLTQGQQVEHMPSMNDAIVSDFDETSVFAWRTGKALYEKTPLFEVVADLNRYFEVPLEIADEDIANLPVTGTFNLNDQNVVVDALESAFSLMAVKRIDGVILLYASQNE